VLSEFIVILKGDPLGIQMIKHKTKQVSDKTYIYTTLTNCSL
jgi:hypothetical protein